MVPPDSTCAICSKPVEDGRFAEDGQILHLWCRTRQLQLRALEYIDRSQTAQGRAVQLVEESAARRSVRQQPRCPLCRCPAIHTDWRPENEWIVVEQCPCHGFFIWALIFERVWALPLRERHDLAHRVRAFRVSHEVWIATTDGTGTGPLVVRTKRPDPFT